MQSELAPRERGDRGRIPPLPPTAVGMMEGPGFRPLRPSVSLWTRVKAFFRSLRRIRACRRAPGPAEP